MGLGAIDTVSGVYAKLDGDYSDFNWSPSGHSYVEAFSAIGFDEKVGLYVSSQNNLAEADNIALKIGKTENTLSPEANFSPDGRKIVFTFAELEPRGSEGTRHLAIANIDGTGFVVLAKAEARRPFFSSDGNSVFYIQQKSGRQVLLQHNLTDKSSTDLIVLPSEFDRFGKAYWTKDGFLALVGRSSNPLDALSEDSRRMLILDIAENKVVYANPAFEQFTNFVGLSN